MSVIKKRSNCPVSCSLDVWGDKWSLLIIRDLMLFDKNTYGDFLKSNEKIATNILASRLLALEENGIITKNEHPASKAKVLYSLTKRGIDLLPVVVETMLWANKYYPLSVERKAILNDMSKDKEAFIKDTSLELQKAIIGLSPQN